MAELPSDRDRYRYFVWFFDNHLPRTLRSHRGYFRDSGRGFGEDAFHAMWFKLFQEFRPETAVEIGVYRGQTLSLWELLSQLLELQVDVWGVTPLAAAGDSESEYIDIDYERDIVESFARYRLGNPSLVRAKSQDVQGVEFLKSRNWDCVYVDGSHDFEDVREDVRLARKCTSAGALLVLDDASLYSEYEPYAFAFAGHPGPSRVAIALDGEDGFREIGSCGHNRVFQRI